MSSIADACCDLRHGSIVAIEGESRVVSTQLRLLPPSSKILILPSLSDEVKRTSDGTAFDARTFVRNVHAAFNARAESARSFLQSSTSEQPKLVFMNGGCVSARTACITTICENVTNGAIREAERLFEAIVQEGAEGLMRPDSRAEEKIDSAAESTNGVISHEEFDEEGQKVVAAEHASSIAMRAADDLDRRTAHLQPSNDIIVHDTAPPTRTATNRDGTMSLVESQHDLSTSKTYTAEEEDPQKDGSTDIRPVVDQENERSSATKDDRANIAVALFTTPHGDSIRETVISVPDRPVSPIGSLNSIPGNLRRPVLGSSRSSALYSQLLPASHRDSSGLDSDHFLAVGDNLHSLPPTPFGGVEFGEAYIVDVQSARDNNGQKRVQSLDRMHHQTRNASASTSPNRPRVLRHSSSHHNLRGERVVASDEEEQGRGRTRSGSGSRSSFESLPRTIFVKASQTTIKRSPTLQKNLMASSVSAPVLSTYIRVFTDRGTDAGEHEEFPLDHEEHLFEETDESGEQDAKLFDAVFPVIEDLIIHFSNMNDEIFESVIRSYRNGSYPVVPAEAEKQIDYQSSDSRPVTADDQHLSNPARPFSPVSQMTTKTDISSCQDQPDIDPSDPYNPANYATYVAPMWPQHSTNSSYRHNRAAAEPPTPATTPPPVLSEVAHKFHEFSPINSNSAVGIQNSLRSVLDMHFGPPETTNYTQYLSKIEGDRFWKPVFRNDDGQGSEGRTVDQILALGCEDGVSKDFFSDISGQVEKLGTKKSGISRTGKLDIRYLIATAMQTHTTLPLTTQSVINPFSDALSLATALVSPLETYLSTNPSIRFLVLTYPASHIGTIISLRRLLGSDILKVSGIIDALSSDPPNFSSGRVSPAPLVLPTLANTGHTSTTMRHKPVPSLSSFARTRAELARQVSAGQSTLNSQPRLSSRNSSHMLTNDPSLSFTKANFLLPSTATDMEISSFLSSIWKCLIEKSAWYTPEPLTPKASPVSSPTPAPTKVLPAPPPIPDTPPRETAEYAPRSPTTLYSTSPGRSKKSNGGRPSKVDQILGNTSSSRSTTLTNAATGLNGNPSQIIGRTRTMDSTTSEKMRREDKAWENFHIGGEGDSDDEIDRMLMPRVPPRVVGKKGNSRKALKWLGLAQ